MADKIDQKVFQSMLTSADADATSVNLFPSEEQDLSKGTGMMSGVHTGLAAAGMIPGIGNAADILDAAIYGLEGDKLGFGLSLISAIPALGLISGGLKITKGTKIGKTLKRQTDMVEKAQDVVKSYGHDPLDSKLVSDVVDQFSHTAKDLVDSGSKLDILRAKGLDFDDALSVIMHYDSKSKKAKMAVKGFQELGMTEAEIFGKEAVEEMAKRKMRGADLVLEDAISGKYGFDKIFK